MSGGGSEKLRPQLEERAARTARWLASVDPGLTVTQRWLENHSRIDLPPAPGADVAYRMMFDAGAYTLFATPVADPEVGIFWHQTFEQMGAPSVEEAEPDFREFVLDVLTHESRIVQRRGMLFHSFACELHRDDEWQRVGGQILVLRTSPRVPPIEGREKHYASAPVVQSAG